MVELLNSFEVFLCFEGGKVWFETSTFTPSWKMLIVSVTASNCIDGDVSYGHIMTHSCLLQSAVCV